MSNPYATPAAELNPATQGFEYVGFLPRLLATMIDAILLAAVTYPLLYLLYGPEYFTENTTLIRGPADVLLSYVFPAVVVVAFWIRKAATPGKMAISARVVDAGTGRRPSTAQAVIRYLGYLLSAVPLGLGYLWVLWDPKRQGWHDKIAGTVVVRPARTGTASFSA